MITKAEGIVATLREFNEGHGFGDYGIPTFTTDEQVDKYRSLRVRITAQHETREGGVSWVGTIGDGVDVVSVENEGRGGPNFYSPAYREALTDLEAFAKTIFPDAFEALDELVASVEMFAEVEALA